MRTWRMWAALAVAEMLWLNASVWAMHPLITDDTGTQGRGKLQVEANGEIGVDRRRAEGVSTVDRSQAAALSLSVGLADPLDLVATLPYQWQSTSEDGQTVSRAQGVSDAAIDLKWRFLERGEFSFVLKPSLTFPLGDEGQGLGAGRSSWRISGGCTWEREDWAVHSNLSYARNENAVDEREDLWGVSLAPVWTLRRGLRLAADLGMQRDPDRTSRIHPAFIIGGVIFSVGEDMDVDFGIKRALNSTETDHSFLAGLTLRY